ncbi:MULTISPECIES: hypothetical protein [Streptomyces]|uniref:Uncharacterized protein n=1 Tax=Streptomyces doudnae TaxID=3075536 RepID=A0ABD5EML0_9ACTN|nr:MULTISPECIES: hypothetical protein [unclassified Streptomyces]MDT0435619.1 hypothetical protein [Streptomyces sp. DSM 41981]MYQ62573.1 hypothetical protein [Streptomyces sp. SID4950]SCD40168.1 hypothetical protein GA0115242_104878 [Streptomyces sp. SolWspMP-5a-2]
MPTTVVFTAKGREIVAGRLIGTSPTQAEPKNLGWGIGTPTAAASDVAPFAEAAESRVAGTSSLVTTTSTNDTYQVVGTLTSASGQTITETFLSDSASKPAATTLSAAIASTSSTSLTVASASGFPGSGNYNIQVDGEVMTVTAGQGTTTWTVTRGVNGSTAATHSSGAVVTGGNTPGSTAIANGSLLLHASFTGLALNSGDSLTATTKLSFS